ncbi:MAG: pitrilysin family protein [Candidatus Eremiobacteraeota bacterium]|nr:pitrilysin family protein [Candidatus Eremiobacteraeota bacterium]
MPRDEIQSLGHPEGIEKSFANFLEMQLHRRPHLDSREREEIPYSLLASPVTRKMLRNGLTVLVKEVYPASVVCISLWVHVGSCHEDDREAGISHFVEHMLFKGTPTRPPGRIAQEVHSLGGYINGFTAYECTCYWIVLPSRYFKTALEIQADASKHTLFDEGEIAKESQVIIEEIRMYEDRPEMFCFEKLMAAAFKEHRYRRPVAGLESAVASLSRDDLVNYYRSHYVPNNMACVVVGDIDTKRAFNAVKDAFEDMAPLNVPENPSPPEPPQCEAREEHYRGDIGSSHLNIGFHVGGIFEEDTYALDLLASILGEGRSSRLHQGLREKLALVNTIGASILAERDLGLFIVEATMEEKKTEATIDELWKQIAMVCREGVTGHELAKAKNMVESSYVFSQETVEGLCKKLGYYEMLGDYTLADRYVQKLYAVSRDDIKRVAERYLVKENSSCVLYAPQVKGALQ